MIREPLQAPRGRGLGARRARSTRSSCASSRRSATGSGAEGPVPLRRDGNRYLELLGGFGIFHVGRNNPRVRAARGALEEGMRTRTATPRRRSDVAFGGSATIVPASDQVSRFAANGVEPDLVGAFLNNSRHGAKAASAKARSGVLRNGQQGRALWCGVAAQPVAKPSTIWYRARGKQKYTALPPSGTHRARILEPLILAVYPRGVIPWIAACRLVWTRRIGPCSAACGRGSGLNRGTGISSSEPCQRSVTRGSVPFG